MQCGMCIRSDAPRSASTLVAGVGSQSSSTSYVLRAYILPSLQCSRSFETPPGQDVGYLMWLRATLHTEVTEHHSDVITPPIERERLLGCFPHQLAEDAYAPFSSFSFTIKSDEYVRLHQLGLLRGVSVTRLPFPFLGERSFSTK
eukprot:5675707-Amphidinium_carterae.1